MIPERIAATITDFLSTCQSPALLEHGHTPLAIHNERLRLEVTPQGTWMEAWDGDRYWSRRIVQTGVPNRKRLDLESSRFGKRKLTVTLIDTADARSQPRIDKSHRSTLTEQFRTFLTRNFPNWRWEAFRSEAKLEHSFSPLFPTALLTRGNEAVAAIAAPNRDTSFHVLTFALIWLDYVRKWHGELAARRLLLYLPSEFARPALLLARHLNRERLTTDIRLYSSKDLDLPLDPNDQGNLHSEVLPRYSRLAGPAWWIQFLARHPEVDSIEEPDGGLSFRVRGLTFARLIPTTGNDRPRLTYGINKRTPATQDQIPRIESLLADLNSLRSTTTPHRNHKHYLAEPERWLESQLRRNLQEVDADLQPAHLYGQVLGSIGGERSALDLLGIDRAGRLQILELKATEDIHLPLQAFDYWLRIRHHQRHNDFAGNGYFPTEQISPAPPRLFLISPSLHFHPMTETVLRYLPRECETVRIGINSDWRQHFDVVLRM
jgi:hypothetical protein